MVKPQIQAMWARQRVHKSGSFHRDRESPPSRDRGGLRSEIPRDRAAQGKRELVADPPDLAPGVDAAGPVDRGHSTGPVDRPTERHTASAATRSRLFSCGLRRQIEKRPIAVPFQEAIEPLREAIPLAGILAGDMFQVGAQEDQAAGALFAFGGTEAGLSTADLLLQIVALAALSFL